MTSANPLQAIWQQHGIMQDCVEIAERAIRRTDVPLLIDTGFVGEPFSDTRKRIIESRTNADDLVIVALWAAFERYLLVFLQEKGRNLLDARPTSLADRLYAKYEREVEYWKIEDILDIFKGDIDAVLLGDAKNIKKHRDWVAHRNPNRPSPGKVGPDFAYRVLSEILEQVEALETRTNNSLMSG